jgi:preprotein translocase subunit SecY
LIRNIANVFRIPELKKKILFTALILIVYRIGGFIPLPGVNTSVLQQMQSQGGEGILNLFNMFTGGNFLRASIFALGIMPYITSSIVFQLLGGVIPYFEKLRKEGPEGQKKLNSYTKIGTIVIALGNALATASYLIHAGEGVVPYAGFGFYFTTMVSLVTGTMFIMWLGDQITDNGLGNGISLIIFAGIIARYPAGFYNMIVNTINGIMHPALFVVALIIMVAVTAAVIYVTEAIRKIPVQYAKRVVGRKMYGGQTTHIPLRVNTAGVIPIIFAQSIIMIPATLAGLAKDSAILQSISRVLSPGEPIHTTLYVILIVMFAYFYTAMVMNPNEMTDNMKKYGGFIPGKKPGKATAKYINDVLVHITLPGAVFFAFVAVMPQYMVKWLNLPFYFGGTGLIIIVGVALDTLQQIESQLVMRHYDGFMKKGKLRGRRG